MKDKLQKVFEREENEMNTRDAQQLCITRGIDMFLPKIFQEENYALQI